MPKTKHSQQYTRAFEGVSASQKVAAAERNGELVTYQQASGIQPPFPGGGASVNQDWNKPFYILKPDGEWYCTLCNAYATVDHIDSNKHKKREEWHEWQQSQSSSSDAKFNKPWFERREEGYYCTLCNQWADEYHLEGKKHKSQEAWRLDQESRPGKAASKAAAPRPAATRQTNSNATDQPDWERVWSSKDSRYYWHDRSSGKVQWQEPEVQTAPSPAPPPPPPPPEEPQLPQGWYSAKDATGKPYYYNTAGQTQWDHPCGTQQPQQRSPQQQQQTQQPASRWLGAAQRKPPHEEDDETEV